MALVVTDEPKVIYSGEGRRVAGLRRRGYADPIVTMIDKWIECWMMMDDE
jgi:hypothetical protein